MPNNQYHSLKKEKIKVSWFYLFKKFTPQTLLHYLFGFLSAFINVKILGDVGAIIKAGKLDYVKGNWLEIAGRLILFGIIVYIHIALGVYLEELYSSHLRSQLVQKYLKANFSQTQKAKFILSNYESDAIIVGSKASQIFNRCFYAAASIIFLFWEIGKNKKQRGFILWIFFALVFLTVVAVLLYKLSYRYKKQRNKTTQKENKYFEEVKNNLEYIKIMGAEKTEIQKSRKSFAKDTKNIFSLALSKSLYGTLPNYVLLKYMPVVLLFFFAENRGLWIALYLLLDKLFDRWKKLFEMLWAYGGYDTYRSSLNQLNYAFAVLEKDADFSTKSFQKTLPAKNPSISFQKVSFTYPETNKKVLDNFSFTFQKGGKYVITGPNGVGKSTLFKLIVKLYQPQQGFISLDDVKLEKVDNLVLREKIVYLPNNPSFFNTRLGDNIVYPEPYQEKIHQQKLENIAKKLGIKSFIDKLPNRWETTIAEKGQNLSEGQKQLVSLVRAFIRDYEICLLDESLSNISSELKEKMLKVIFQELKDKTVIIISHDREVIKYVDEVYKFASRGLIKEN